MIECTREGPVATAVLRNPGKKNAIDVATWQELARVFGLLNADTSLRCVVIRGADGDFSAGADIEEFPRVRADRAQGMHYHERVVGPALQAVADCPHPLVALIEGVCIGGGLEVACCADLRIAGESARLGVPINRLGFPLALGELSALLGLISPAVALELLLEGRLFSAAEAQHKGLLTRVVADADLAEEADRTVDRIVSGSPAAARANKRNIRRLAAAAPPLSREERAAGHAFLDSADYREGLAAFLEKRTPRFTGS
jgi:enoyl-CoA hydratase/carnithine racemase